MGAAALLAMGVAGCSSGSGSGASAGSSVSGTSGSGTTSATPSFTEAQAQEVFERYVKERQAATEKGDAEALARVEDGQLLKENRATAQLHQANGTKNEPIRPVRPVYLIPQTDSGEPQSFAVLNKTEGRETDRSSTLTYFTRDRAGGEWKAVVATWVVTEAPPTTAPTEAPSSTPVPGQRSVRPKVMPALARGTSGGVELSPTAETDTAVCGRYAQYLSFTVPAGKPESADFERGDFTNGLVDYFNGWDQKVLERSLSFRSLTNALPTFRLKDGGSLVTCTLEGTYRDRGRTPADWIKPGDDTDALLGRGRKWSSIEEVWSAEAVVEVPQGGRPATVLSSEAYGATTLSVTGVEWK
ncbi:hypothetical protein ACH4E7_44160 [Kitasatospora sp. NPDC018058]|uniref:hypothetical protein n=1 Tax=Kitasatospora sp. NPDC018058 TaxID=3364025 RepID=UPI0037C11F0D